MDLWLLVFALVVVLPVIGWLRFRRLVSRYGPVPTALKLRAYASIIVTQWALVAWCAWVLARRGLDLGDLGVAFPPTPLVSIVAACIGVSLAVATVRGGRHLRHSREELPSHLRHVVRILPANGLERAAFFAVALTAGFCEEVLYRGFLLYALDGVLPSPWLSVALAALAFGIGHAYQGPRGMVLTGVLGGVFGVLYRAGGSLWPVIVLHAAIDVVNGFALGELARARDDTVEEVPVPEPEVATEG